MVTGSIAHIIDEFKNLEGVTDEVKAKLGDFKNIGITGGALFGAGAFGLDKTLETLDMVMEEAASFEDSMTVLMNKSFGKNLIDPAYKEQVEEVKAYFSDWGMEIGASTTFDSTDILDSFTELSKGGVNLDEIYDTGKANAYFAQVNRVAATATAEGTVQMKEGFRLVGDEVMQGMELINQYADATIADSLALQQALGNVAGTASTIWGSRDRMEITKDTVALTSITTNVLGNEARSATDVKNFLNRANMTENTMSKPQKAAMTDVGWLDSNGHSIFIDYEKGMLKDAEDLQRILKETDQQLTDVEFGNLLKTVFREQAAPVAAALAKGIDLGELNVNASAALSIADQVELEMNRYNAVKDTFQENISNFKKVIGAPFLETGKNIFRGLSEQVERVTEYFKQHPEVSKFIFALAGGLSIFLMVTGTIMLIIAAVGSLKLAFNLAGPQIIGAIKPVLGVMIPVMLAVLALAGVAYILYRNWDKVGPHFQNIFGKIQTILSIGKQDFDKFVAFILPLISSLLRTIEKGVVWIAVLVLPMINKGLDVIIKMLQGDFKGAWESLSPIARTFFAVFSPVILTIIAYLGILAIQTMVTAACKLVLAGAMGVAAVAGLIWRGIVLAGTAAQWLWNIAMGTGTAQTLLQKAAVIGFLPFILAIRAAKLIWTGVQWALNAAMAANPIAAVILIIAGLIAIVVLVVTHFKEIVEWVGKAWEKLKGFLGFKKDIKEELEDPITVSVQNDALEGIEIPVMPTYDNINQDDINKLISGENGAGLTIPTDIDLSTMNQDWMKDMPGMEDDGTLGILADLNLSGMNDEWMKGIPGMEEGSYSIPANIDTSLFSEEMFGITEDLNVTGTDAGLSFSEGFNDPQVISATKAAVEAINNTITDNLITQSDMTTWGSNLLQSFVDGMRSKFTVLELAAKEASSYVADYLKVQSPTRKGDLNTNNLWGGNLIKSFADGMLNNMGLLRYASAEASGNISLSSGSAIKFKPVNESGKNNGEGSAPIFMYVYGAKGQSEEEIADKVIKKLEKKNRGKVQTSKSSLTMSPNGYKGGY